MRSLFDVPRLGMTGSGIRRILISFCFLALLAAQAYAQTTLTSSVIAGGGGRSSGASFTLYGTIGQSASGATLSGDGFSIKGGFIHTVAAQPSVTINQAPAQVDPTSQFPILFTAVFSEPVTGFTSAGITFTGTAPGTKTVVVAGTGATYSVAVSGITGPGTVIADIPAGAAVSTTTGFINTPSTSTDNTITIEVPDPPTLTGIVPGVGAPGTTVTATLTGTNFIFGATNVITGSEITVIGNGVLNSTSMTVTFLIDAGAALGPRDVTVNTAGGTSETISFTVVPPFPDLTVTSTHSGTFGVSFDETYAVQVSNVGSSVSGAYTVTDTLPTGLTFVSGIGTGWSCLAAGQVVTCSQPTGLAADELAPVLALTVAVSAPAVPEVTHTVSVDTAGDVVPSNNSDSDFTTVAPVPTPTFEFNPNPVVAGQPATMDVRISSAFPHELTGTVTLTFVPQGTLPDDPAVQFAGGGRTVDFRIPENTLDAIFGLNPAAGPEGFQPGTVAGTLDFSGIFRVGSSEIPFAPSPGGGGGGFVIPEGPPTVIAVSTLVEQLPPAANGDPQKMVTPQITLYSTTREVTEITLTFNTFPRVTLNCGTPQGCSASGNSMTFQAKDVFDNFFATTTNGLAQIRLPLVISGTVYGGIIITFSNDGGVSDAAVFGLP